MRLSIRKILRPTRSLYDIWFKSYDSNSCFHAFWWPWPWPLADIYKKMFLTVSWVFRIYCKKIILIGAKLWPVGGVTDRQTDKQTDKRYWPIYFAKFFQNSQSNERRSESSYFAKSLLLDCKIIDLDCNMSRSKVKDTVTLVLMHQMKCAQWVE